MFGTVIDNSANSNLSNITNQGQQKIDNSVMPVAGNNKSTFASWCMPDWTSAISINLPYTVPKNGYILRNLEPNAYIHLNIGNTGLKSFAGAGSNANGVIIPALKGNTFSSAGNSGTWHIYFIPCSGG